MRPVVRSAAHGRNAPRILSTTSSERVPVRQWVLSFPIPLRILLAAHPQLHCAVLQIVHRVIAIFLIKHSGFKRALKPHEAHTGAVTLIQRFGSAANLNIHLHCPRWEGKGPTPSLGSTGCISAPSRGRSSR